jgi:hypothetical protein
VAAGTALQGWMLHAALKAGADIRTGATVEQILVENGRAAGVLMRRDGTESRIDGRLGVLINAGGFARNQNMLDRFIPGISAEWTSAGHGDTGEMIIEAYARKSRWCPARNGLSPACKRKWPSRMPLWSINPVCDMCRRPAPIWIFVPP